MLDLILSIFLEWVFLLPNHLFALVKGQKFELKYVKTKDYGSALVFWILVGLTVFFTVK